MDGKISAKMGLCVINPIVQEVYWWYCLVVFLAVFFAEKLGLNQAFFD